MSVEATVRRNWRALTLIALLIVASGLLLGFQTINLGGFQRGGNTLLGLSLGLDLQGGSHLVYQAESIADAGDTAPRPPSDQEMLALQRIIERRVNSSGLGEPIIQILGDDRLLIQLPGVRDTGRAKIIIGETARLEFKHRKLNVARNLTTEGAITMADVVSISAEALPDELNPDAAPVEPQTAATPASEIASQTPEAGSAAQTPEAEPAEAEADATPQPDAEADAAATPAIIIEFTPQGAEKFDEVLARLNQSLEAIGTGGIPSALNIAIDGNEPLVLDAVPSLFIARLPDSNRYVFPYPQPQAAVAAGEGLHDLARAQSIVGSAATATFIEQQGQVDEDFGLGGDNLDRAYASLHATSGQPIINLEFDSTGTRLFGEKTTEIAGSLTDSIAVFLDGNELIAPVVRQPITTGTAIVEGGFTLERANDISLQLEGGRLPIPITLIQERGVDAILGADSLAKSVVAGMVGLALVFLFMTLYYRVPGLVASVALLIYAAMVLAIFKLLPVTLTLSGVAATILSVGMAVDANVLIFERMKDELRNGRTLISAINIGFNRAWPAIRDSNVSTLITCGILFYFSNQLGTTIVQGFAVTLAIGVMISMFSAIVVSRTILRVIATTRLSRHLGAFVPTGAADMPQQAVSPAVQRS